MPNTRKSLSKSRATKMFKSGKHSMQSIANALGVSRGLIKRRFKEWSIPIPTQSVSQKARLKRMTHRERQNLTENARKAQKMAYSYPAQLKKAKTNELRKTSATPESLSLCDMLADLSPVPEMSIDVFNVDIGIPCLKVAIELDGGNWHAGGRVRPRDMRKERILQKNGWIVLRYLSDLDIDYIRSALNRISPPPI